MGGGRELARKSDRPSRALSDFVNNLAGGREQAQKAQNSPGVGRSPGGCDCSQGGLPFPPRRGLFEMLFATCSDTHESQKHNVEWKKLDKRYDSIYLKSKETTNSRVVEK